MPTMQERVAERYPSLVALLKQPEIGRLLTQAVQQNWSPGVFQSKFMASQWFRRQSESQRRWWVTAQTDPGEAGKQRRLYQAELANFASSMGVPLSQKQQKRMTELGLQTGVEVDSAWMRGQLIAASRAWTKGGHLLPQGALRTTATEIRRLAEREYVSNQDNRWYTRRMELVTVGALTMEDVENELRMSAMKRYPHMKEQLAQGDSVATIVEPYRNIIASELELGSTSNVDILRKWRPLLGIKDAKTGKMRLPTESEVIKMARSEPKYWETAGGQQKDAAVAQTLAQAFGRRV